MVIFASMLAIIASSFTLVSNQLQYTTYITSAEGITIALILLLSIIALFTHRHPWLGVAITLLAFLYLKLSDSWFFFAMLDWALSAIMMLSGIIITLSAHNKWVEKKKENYNAKVYGEA